MPHNRGLSVSVHWASDCSPSVPVRLSKALLPAPRSSFPFQASPADTPTISAGHSPQPDTTDTGSATGSCSPESLSVLPVRNGSRHPPHCPTVQPPLQKSEYSRRISPRLYRIFHMILSQFSHFSGKPARLPQPPAISLPGSICDSPHCAVPPVSDWSKTDSKNRPHSGHIPIYGRQFRLRCPEVLQAAYRSLPDIPLTEAARLSSASC